MLKKCIGLFLIAFSFFNLIAQEKKIRIIPSVGVAEGIFAFENNPHKYSRFTFTKKEFNPFYPKKYLFGIELEKQWDSKNSFSIGIATSFSAYAYNINLGIRIDTTFYSSSLYTVSKERVFVSEEFLRNTYKVPISYRYFIRNKKFQQQTDYFSNPDEIQNIKFKNRLNANFFVLASVELLYLFNRDNTDQLTNDKTEFMNGDTLRFVTHSLDRNIFGASLSAGGGVVMMLDNKQWLRLQVYFSKGLVDLYKEQIHIYKNRKLEYENAIYSKGSLIYFGISVPVSIINKKYKPFGT